MRRLACAFLPAFFLSLSFAQSSHPAPPASASGGEDTLARIVGYSMLRGGASNFLEELTDQIGGRITGSAQSRTTADLILRTLKEAGFENAHPEEYEVNPSWQHGSASGEVVRPVRRSLYIGSYGWVPGTAGPVEAQVADIGSGDGHSPLPSSVRGAAVLVDLASSLSSTIYVGTRALLARQLAQAGAAAMLIVSDKPDRMLYCTRQRFCFIPVRRFQCCP
jgi:hypothetical protein